MLSSFIHYYKTRFKGYAWAIVLLWILPFSFLSAASQSVLYSIDIFKKISAHYYPGHPSLAYVILFILPNITLAFTITAIAAETVFRLGDSIIIKKYISKTLNTKILTQIKGLALYNGGNYDKFLFTHLLVAATITLIFSLAYYALGLNSISNQHLFNSQLYLSRLLLATLTGYAILVFSVNRYRCKEGIISFISEPVSPHILAALRVFVGFFMFTAYLGELIFNSYWASMPHSALVNLPFMGWFIQNIPINQPLYNITCVFGIAISFLIMFGLLTRAALIINIPLSIYVFGVPLFFGKLFHIQMWVWVPAIFALSDCATVWSLDSLIKKHFRKENIDTAPSAAYGLPMKIIMLQFGIIYFFAGFKKVANSGLAWALSESMVNQMRMEWFQHYNKVPGIRLDLYPTLCHISGIAVILFELFFPFLLFSKVGRYFCFFGGLAMHKIINYFMYIGFEDLQKLYVMIPDWQSILVKTKSLLGRPTVTSPSPEPFAVLKTKKAYKGILTLGFVILGINFLCSAFSINSWPFSSYPTYSAIVKPYSENIYFAAYDSTGKAIDVYAEGKASKFRMESYTPLEDDIINNYKAGDTIIAKNRLEELWYIWVSNVPKLKVADSLATYIQRTPINPDSVDYHYDRLPVTTMKLPYKKSEPAN